MQVLLANESQTSLTEKLSDEQLLERFADHDDRAAFKTIHDRIEPELRAFLVAKYFPDDPQLADDACQRAFLKLFEKHESFDRRYRLRPWLFSIGANVSISILRARNVMLASSFTGSEDGDRDYDPLDRAIEKPDEIAMKDERDARLHESLAFLRPEDREAIETVYFRFHGRDYEGAAETLGIPVGSLKTRIARALRTLRSRLGDDVVFSADA